MKSDELLKNTLEQTGLPVKAYEYRGIKSEYIVYNEEDERSSYHADDLPQGISMWWQVHLFAPESSDIRSRKRQVRNLLLKAGFLLGETDTIFEKGTKTIHVVISCNMEEEMEE